MSEKRTVPDPAPDEETLQRRFDQAAANSDLPLAPSEEADPCAVGIAIVPAVPTKPLVRVARPTAEARAAAPDEELIARLIQDWESVHPDELLATWERIAADPFIAVGTTWVDALGKETIRAGLESAEFAAQLVEYPPYRPRKVKISQLETVYLGANRAVATYRVEEAYRNGRVFAGNSAMILMRDPGAAWRLAVFTKHNRFDDFVPAERTAGQAAKKGGKPAAGKGGKKAKK